MIVTQTAPLHSALRQKFRCQEPGRRGRSSSVFQVRATYRRGTRFTRILTSIPRRLDLYFKDNLLRKALWCMISTFAGFYSGNMVTLSVGALAINDVVAAVVTVGFCEVTSKFFYEQFPDASLNLIFANFFKIGVTCALVADAFKLSG